MGKVLGIALWGGKVGLLNARGCLKAASSQHRLELSAVETMLCALTAVPACYARAVSQAVENKPHLIQEWKCDVK